MGGRRLAYRKLDETLRSVTDVMSGLKAKIDAVCRLANQRPLWLAEPVVGNVLPDKFQIVGIPRGKY